MMNANDVIEMGAARRQASTAASSGGLPIPPAPGRTPRSRSHSCSQPDQNDEADLRQHVVVDPFSHTPDIADNNTSAR